MAQPGFKYFDVIVAVFAVTLVVSNVVATKIVDFGHLGPLPIVADGGVILFPLTYILGDIVTEVYGFRRARRVIWIGFGLMIFASGIFRIVGWLPADASYADQAAYDSVLGMVQIVLVASLTAYLFGQFMNSFVLTQLKARTKGNHLWLRLIGSTLVGQFLDTLIFCAIMAVGFGMSMGDFISYVVFGWLFKTLVEVAVLPVTYGAVTLLKRHENLELPREKSEAEPA